MSDPPRHQPVLLAETLELLAPAAGEIVVDGTVGGGGHSLALAKAVGPQGLVIGLDVDPAGLQDAADRVRAAGGRFEPVHTSFVRAPQELAARDLRADVVLADLGFSSAQMDDPARGLSFSAEGPLDMRLDPRGPVTAAELLASLSERELADVILRYGEDPWAARIARKLAQARRDTPIRTTTQLARLVVEAYGPRARRSRMHPATRTFMALRIAVNDELTALRALLDAIADGTERASWLAPAARVAVISFHSLEDRMVKQTFVAMAQEGVAERLTRRPVIAGPDEVAANPRSRSAKLRAIRLVS